MAAAKKPAGSSSVMATMIVVLMLTAVAAGTGLVAGTMLLQPATGSVAKSGHAAPEPSAAAAEQHGTGEGQAGVAAAEPDEPAGVKVIPFPPVLTSLAAPSGTWIRIEGSMLVAEHAEEKPEILVEQAATNVLAFLRTVKLAQIEGPSGLLYFRQDLNDLVSAMSEGQVREVLIHGLVVE